MIALYALADVGYSLNVGLPIERTIGACCTVVCFESSNRTLRVLRNADTNW